MADRHRRSVGVSLCVKSFVFLSLLTLSACDTVDSERGALDAGGSLDGVISCSVTADCESNSTCKTAACVNGRCEFEVLPEGSPCDDGSACTTSDACVEGVCQGDSVCDCEVTADCASKEDGNLCTGTLYCKANKCTLNPASVVTCLETGEACRVNQCDPTSGTCKVSDAKDGVACDDGLLCSDSDECSEGVCKGDESGCACYIDADCADDGDLCNGTPYCDLQGPTPVCKVNPASVIKCANKDTACATTTCNPKTAKCELIPKADGVACDLDGNLCSDDMCEAGMCVPGPLSSKCTCKQDADCGVWEDGDLCTGTLYCNLAFGQCVINAATVIRCPFVNDTGCTRSVCDPKTGACGMKPYADGSICDDGLHCTAGDACKDGSCTASKPACQCQKSADCAQFAPENPCLGEMFCDKAYGQCKLNPVSVVFCASDKDTACLTNQCDPKTAKCALTPSNEGGICQADSTWCTSPDTCKVGKCVAGDNQCGCKGDGDCQLSTVSNLCTAKYTCNKASGKCEAVPGGVVKCEGGTQCAPLKCDPSDGKCKPNPVANGVLCEKDGKVCSKDQCDKGQCVKVAELCQCWEDADCTPYDDGDLCTGALFCDKSGPTPLCKTKQASQVTCDVSGDTTCSKNLCDPKTGKCSATAVANTTPCDDGDACTTNDTCANGTCVPGVAVLCAKKICQQTSCEPASGCTFKALANETKCDDGDFCTTGTVCKGGVCDAGAETKCDDGNPCTVDACNSVAGQCTSKPATVGVACGDANVCGVERSCDAVGVCKAPSATKDGLGAGLWTAPGAEVVALQQRAKGGWALLANDGVSKSLMLLSDAAGKKKDKTLSYNGAKGIMRALTDAPDDTGDVIFCGERTLVTTVATIVRIKEGSPSSFSAASEIKLNGSSIAGACVGVLPASTGNVFVLIAGSKPRLCLVSAKEGETNGTVSKCTSLAVSDGDFQVSKLSQGGKGVISVAGIGKTKFWYQRFKESDLSIITSKSWLPPSNSTSFSVDAVSIGAEGWAIVTGNSLVAGKGSPWVIREGTVDEGITGSEFTKASVSSPFALGGLVMGAAWHWTATIIFAGQTQKTAASVTHGWFGIAHSDKFVASRVVVMGDKSSLQRALQLPNQDILLAGWTERAGKRSIQLLTLDTLTRPTCQKVGAPCQAKKLSNCDDSQACSLDFCDTDTGKCVNGALFESANCDDGDACTINDECDLDKKALVCGKSADIKTCDDDNPCTTDSCDKTKGCQNVAKTQADCDDGLVCTTQDKCTAGKCVGTAKSVGAGCVGGACDAQSKCVPFAGGERRLWVQAGWAGYVDSTGQIMTWGKPPGSGTHPSLPKSAEPPYEAYAPKVFPGSSFITGSENRTCAINSQGGVICSGSKEGITTKTFNLEAGYGTEPGAAAVPLPPMQWLTGSGAGNGKVVNNVLDMVGVSQAGDVYEWYSHTHKGNMLKNGDKYKTVEFGSKHVCGITQKDEVQCWGEGGLGQLGTGDTPSSVTFANAKPVTTITKPVKLVCVGDTFTCAVAAKEKTHELYCWGRGYYGELGDGKSTAKVTTPTQASLFSSPVTSLSCGSESACLVSGGEVYCWGRNQYGQLGIGNTLANQTPTKLSVLKNVTDVVTFRDLSCARLSSGEVSCWGLDPDGLLLKYKTEKDGDQTVPSSAKLLSEGKLSLKEMVSSRNTTVLTVNENKKVYFIGKTSGFDGIGPVGGTNMTATTLTVVDKITDVTSLSMGGSHVCALQNGKMSCWGFQGTVKVIDLTGPGNQYVPTPVTLPNGEVPIQICTGLMHNCALTKTGKVFCWGENAHYQSGAAYKANNVGFTEVVKSGAAGLGCSHQASCAIDSTGQLSCWGRNDKSQLGDGKTQSRATPTKVNGAVTFASVSGGDGFFCGMDVDKAVYCWGSDPSYGGLKSNSGSTQPQKVDLPGVYGAQAKKLKVGGRLVCAQLVKDDHLRCWGKNGLGGLGQGTFTSPVGGKGLPVEPKGVGKVSDFWVGFNFACAKQATGGKTLCWGANGLPINMLDTWGSISPLKVTP